MGEKIRDLVESGVLDADSAGRLEKDVVDKIEAMSEADLEVIKKFNLEIAGHPWEPESDGSIF